MLPVTVAAALSAALPAPCLAAPPGSHSLHATTRNVAIVLYHGVELLDFAGPAEVFAAAGRNAFNVYTVAVSTEPLVSQGCVTVTPEYTFDTCPAPDIVVVPGGSTWGLDTKPIVSFLKRTAPSNEILLTVCTGAFFAADAGLLEGRSVTTHWTGISSLKRKDASLDVKEKVRFVDSGSVVTSAGVSAGIDGALHVVDRLLGRRAAERTARYMEYRWQPEGPAVEPITTARRALEAWHARDFAGAIDAYTEYVSEHASDPIAQHRLGVSLNAAGKHQQAITHLKAALDFGAPEARGDIVYAYLSLQQPKEALPYAEAASAVANPIPRDVYNLACTYALLGETDKALDALDRALKVGFVSPPERIRNEEDFASLRDSARFKAILAKIGT